VATNRKRSGEHSIDKYEDEERNSLKGGSKNGKIS
jgi:hypothetical protein